MSGPVQRPLTTKTSDGATTVRPTTTLSFNAADFDISKTGSEATISLDSSGSGAALTQSQIGFGNASNLLSGSANFTFVDESGSVGPTVTLTGDKPILIMQDDTSATDFFSEFTQSGASLELRSKSSAGASVEIFRTRADSITFNDDAVDMDTIIKGDNEGELFYVDGGQDNIGIGNQAASDVLLHVYDKDDRFSAATLRVQKNDSTDGDTGPILELYRYDSATVSGSTQGSLRYYGTDDDGSTKVLYSAIKSVVNPVGAGSAGSGWLYLQTAASGSMKDMVILRGDANQVVVNESQQGTDFRVESDANVNLLRCDASQSNIGILGEPTSTTEALHVFVSGSDDSVVIESSDTSASSAPDLVLYRNPSDGSVSTNDFIGRFDFRGLDNASNDIDYGIIATRIMDPANDYGRMVFFVADGTTLNLDNAHFMIERNAVVVNNANRGSVDFYAKGTAKQIIRTDADNNNLGIGTSSPNTNCVVHITDDGTKANTVRIESTDNDTAVGPVLDMRRNNADATGTDGDNLGVIQFVGLDDGGGVETYSRIRASAADTHSTLAEGALEFLTIYNGSEGHMMRIGPIGDGGSTENAVTVNPDGTATCDFRVRGDTLTNLVRTDGSIDMVGIGQKPTSSAGAMLQVSTSAQFYRETSNQYTANHDVTIDQAHGHVLVMNASSSGANTFTLPDVPVIGMHVTFCNIHGSNGMTISVAGSTTNQINGAGTGGSSTVSTTTKFQTITCHYIATDVWVATEPAVAA